MEEEDGGGAEPLLGRGDAAQLGAAHQPPPGPPPEGEEGEGEVLLQVQETEQVRTPPPAAARPASRGQVSRVFIVNIKYSYFML